MIIFGRHKAPRCFAPKSNLLFQQDGSVYPCHYNRGYLLGKYPEMNIKEIWESNNRKALEKEFDKGEFGNGCAACKTSYNKGLFNIADYKKYNFLSNQTSNYPVQFEFQISNKCNMECLVCSGEYSSGIRKNREHFPPLINPYNNIFVKEINEFLPKLKYAGFTGGEPFLNQLYFDIWKNIKYINPEIKIAISSNGSIWNKEIDTVLDGLNVSYTISFDSLAPDIYSKIRIKGNHDKVLNNILEIAKINKERLTIKFLVMPMNLLGIPELFQYFNNINISLLPKFVQHPIMASIRILPKDEIIKAAKYLDSKVIMFKQDTQTQKNNLLKYKDIVRELYFWAELSLFTKKEELEKLKTEELIFQFKQKVKKHYIANNQLIIYNSTIEQFEKILHNINDESYRRNVIIATLLLPIYIITNELQRKSFETIYSRFLQNALVINENMSISNSNIHY
jgi:radical SAM protein with 4Fe4S-binding SPASM domain